MTGGGKLYPIPGVNIANGTIEQDHERKHHVINIQKKVYSDNYHISINIVEYVCKVVKKHLVQYVILILTTFVFRLTSNFVLFMPL